MKIEKGIVELEDASSFYPTTPYVSYTEVGGTKVIIPMRLLVRLYEGSRYHIGKQQDWDKFCGSLFEDKK